MRRQIVLYVEDDDAAYLLLRLTLEEADAPIELHRAIDGEQALAFLRQNAPFENAARADLILLDLNLPKKGGMEVLADVKADERLNSIPVVVFSSSSRTVDKNRSLELGAKEYLVKPSSFDQFVESVKRACAAGEQHLDAGASSE